MALPPKEQYEPPFSRYGIVVGVYPSSDPAFDIEIARTRGSSASTSFTTIAQLNGMGLRQYVFEDQLPNDNVTSWYKARHTLPGYTAGPFTTAIKAKPTLILDAPESADRKYPYVALSGNALAANIHLSSNATVRFGAAGTTGYIRKYYMFGAAEFNPITSTVADYSLNEGYLRPHSAGGAASTVLKQFRISVSLPVGAVVRGASIRVYRSSTSLGGRVLATFRRYSSATSTGVELGTNGFGISSGSTVAGNTWLTISSTAFAHTVSTPYANYDFNIQMKSGSAIASIPRFQWGLLTVDIPSLDIAR